MRYRKRQEVDLFNFSFLDILACVIGLLIFILTIVVVSSTMPTNGQSDARLSNAEHRLQQATADSDLSHARRTLVEQVLTQRAHDMANPKATANAIRGEIGALNNEKIDLDTATNNLSMKLQNLKTVLDGIKQDQSNDSSLADMQRQLRQLDEQTADLVARSAQQRQQAASIVEHVSYYIPHRHEVVGVTLWVEVSEDRVWCIKSDDYDVDQIDADSVQYTRHAEARGTSVSALVANQVYPPPPLAAAVPNETVLDVALHPNGYEAFRQLRQWAWQKGFEVNWEPQVGDSIVLTRAQHVYAQ
jgi:hypothetical protein